MPFPLAPGAPGAQPETLRRARFAHAALRRLSAAAELLHVRLAAAGRGARRHVPGHARHRGAETDQHRLADRRYRGRHLRLRLVAHGGRPALAGVAGRPAVAAIPGVPRRIRGGGAGGERGRPAGGRQATAVHPARRDLDRGAQDVPQEPLPGAVPGAQPAARAARAIACVARPVASTCAPPKWRRCAWSLLATRLRARRSAPTWRCSASATWAPSGTFRWTRPARRTVPWRRSVAERQAGRASAASLRGHNCATSMPASISAQPK